MSKLTLLLEAISSLSEAWADASDSNDLSRKQLISAMEAVGVARRRLDAVQVDIAAGLAKESRADLGADSLAKEHGFRTPAKMLSTTLGVSTGDAIRLIKVGESTAARTDLLGARLPAKYPLVAAALEAGTLGAPAASLITALLDRCRMAAGAAQIQEGERILVESATGLAIDDVRKLIVRAEAWLDPDGIEPREQERHAQRSLTLFERDGFVHLNAKFDVESAAPIVSALRGYVSAAFAARKEAVDPEGDKRSVPMLQADALSLFCAHMLECKAKGPNLAGATIIVRMTLTDLQDETNTGSATIDGIDQPISASAARRMAANGGTIPCVLGSESEVLDWGREKRLFTRAQRLALAERDGGCAMCGLPPEMTRAHHIRWWQRHRGPTDLDNGVLLCETCHHRIHDNDWNIRITGTGIKAKVWFIPPCHIDPQGTPRLGGRARYDLAA